jgi:hypothetical protein
VAGVSRSASLGARRPALAKPSQHRIPKVLVAATSLAVNGPNFRVPRHVLSQGDGMITR